MIVTTIGKILEAAPILKEISNYEFKAKTAFKIVRIVQASEKELKNFEQAKYVIFKKYGEVDENGELKVENKNIKIKKEYIDDYNNDIMELLNTQIELIANPIDLEELEEFKFTPIQLAQLGNFIVE